MPGGKAAYPSSVLMNVIPAKVAGVREVIMVVPAPDEHLEPVVLAAAALAGADRVFTVGGAQAIAALAYGTATIAAVDKIVGPGNVYVATAKAQVYGRVGIDMIAGPSEILIICDGLTPPDWIAMDLFSQAEHDEQAQAILLCPDPAYLDAVAASIERLLPGLARSPIVRTALAARGALIRVADLEQAMAIANRIAPEHLELSVAEPRRWLPQSAPRRAIFLGRHTPEALGDYCAGPNHVLPTAGTARFSSPLGVYDFQKRSSIIEHPWPARPSSPARAHPGRGRGPGGARAIRRLPGRRVVSIADRIARFAAPRVRELTPYPVEDATGLLSSTPWRIPTRCPPCWPSPGCARSRGRTQPLSDPHATGAARACWRPGLTGTHGVVLGNGSTS